MCSLEFSNTDLYTRAFKLFFYRRKIFFLKKGPGRFIFDRSRITTEVLVVKLTINIIRPGPFSYIFLV